jgi:hypothetical protein
MISVLDRSHWGKPNCPYPLVRLIILDWTCPICGGPRGTIYNRTHHEDGSTLLINVWLNPCGHVDKYQDVIEEADNARI